MITPETLRFTPRLIIIAVRGSLKDTTVDRCDPGGCGWKTLKKVTASCPSPKCSRTPFSNGSTLFYPIPVSSTPSCTGVPRLELRVSSTLSYCGSVPSRDYAVRMGMRRIVPSLLIADHILNRLVNYIQKLTHVNRLIAVACRLHHIK